MIASLNTIWVSRKALRHNFHYCRQQAHGAGVIVLVKADAYGHGMEECAAIFAQEGAAGLAVAEAVEGIALRQAGHSLPIYVLAGVVPQSIAAIVEYGLTPIVTDDYCLELFNQEAAKRGIQFPIHLKVDAGMGRQGTLPEAFMSLVRKSLAQRHLVVRGVMAHFPQADDRQSENSIQVLHRFQSIASQAKSLLPPGCVLHLANSGGLFYVAQACFDQVRPGIALYGYYPDGACGKQSASPPLLQPAMRFTSSVLQVRELPAGHSIGYGGTYVTTHPTRVALLPLGYEDGYLRRLSNRGAVLIGGKRARILGRISMNLSAVDITGIDSVHPGDEAVVMGSQGEEAIDADEIAAWMETINYEVLCLFGNLNQRLHID